MGNTITEPVIPNDITTHRAVGGGVTVGTVHVHVHEIPSLYCTTFFSAEAVHNQSSNAEREDNDTSHNSDVEQNCGNCKSTSSTHTNQSIRYECIMLYTLSHTYSDGKSVCHTYLWDYDMSYHNTHH